MNRRPAPAGPAALSILLMVLSLFLLAGCGAPDPATAEDTAGAGSLSVALGADSASRRVDFTLPDLTGQPRRLSEWDGDLVILNFWATWCPPCKKEMPLFQDRYERHAEQGLTFVAVAVDELAETRDFVATFGIEFPVLIGQDEAIAVGREYGNRIGALPFTVVIDREGLVRETHRGEVTEGDLEDWLQRYL